MFKKRRSLARLSVVFALLLSAGLFLAIANAAEKKILIAVMPLGMGQVKQWWTWDWDVGDGIAETITTELVNTNKFRVIERI